MNRNTQSLELLETRICFAAGDEFAGLIDNDFMPLIPGTTLIYRGVNEDGDAVRTRFNVTDLTKLVDGVTTTVVREREYVNSQVVEDTRDFFAQDKQGNVWLFGSASRQFENGALVGTEGSWLAGVDNSEASIVMKASPAVGEQLPLIIEGEEKDTLKVLSLAGKAKVAFGSFGDCLKTEESSSGEDEPIENKYYAPGIGLVLAKEVSGGSEVKRLAYVQLAPQAFGRVIDNPYFPLTPGTTFIFRGSEEGVPVRVRTEVTRDTRVVAGVTTTVVRDRAYVDGELVEDTFDWYAQDKAGNVWYFGEDSSEIEDGEVVSKHGSWEAGVDGATAGIIMRAKPGVGDAYHQELAPEVAEDEARVLSRGAERFNTPFQKFGTNVLKTAEFTRLEPEALEHKFYAPGIGFIGSQAIDGGDEVLRLAYVLSDA